MKTYYRGELALLHDVEIDYKQDIAFQSKERFEFIEYIENDFDIRTKREFKNYLINNTFYENEFEVIGAPFEGNCHKVCYNVNNNTIIKPNKSRISIVYELVKDNCNHLYAKEIFTGLLFPFNFDVLFCDFEIARKNTKDSWNDFTYTLYANKCLKFPGFLYANSFLINNEVISEKTLNEYLSQFEKGISNRYKKKKLIKNIKILAEKNKVSVNPSLLKSVKQVKIEVEEKSSYQISRQKQSSETLCMENIDFLLNKMKVKDPDKYQILKKKYEILLNDSNLVLAQLAYLEGEIEFHYYFCNSDATDILENLTILRKEYLTNILENNPKNTDLTFKKINKINEIFLKVKNNYSILSQREVLKNISFLYLMEVYENRNSITLEELENSYFRDNLKSIILCIEGLQESNLITCDLIYSLNEEITCENVFNMIKSIKFNTLAKKEMQKIIKRI